MRQQELRSPEAYDVVDAPAVVETVEPHNHGFANELGGLPVDQGKIAPSPYHETAIRDAA